MLLRIPERLRPWAWAAVLYATAAVFATWPLAARLFTHLPLGSLTNATVPFFNLWTLEWNAHGLARGYAGYWDAPIFYPTPSSFALSEAQGLTGIGFALLAPIAGSVAAYNWILLGTLTLNALCARRLFCLLGVSQRVATLAGLLALGLPFVWKELGVLQLVAMWPLWLALSELALLSSEEPPSPIAAVRLSVWCAATLWTCSYYALFLGVFLLLAAALFIRRSLFSPSMLRAWLAAVLVLGAAAAPMLLYQQPAMRQYARSSQTIRNGSATAAAYMRLPRGAFGGCVLSPLAGATSKRSLSPGLVLVVMAAVGAWASRRSPRRRYLVWCAVSTLVALVLSFGTRWWIGSFAPYEAIVERFLPGFANVRSPYRFAAFVQLFVLVFAALGLDRFRTRFVPLAAIVLLAFFEVLPWPSPLARFPNEAMQTPWMEYLTQHPGGAVAMVPPSMSGDAADYESTAIAMLQSLRHGHPLLNGYSGFFPPKADSVQDALRKFPDARSRRLLRYAEVRYAVVDKRWLGPRSDAELAPLTRVFDSTTHAIYRVP